MIFSSSRSVSRLVLDDEAEIEVMVITVKSSNKITMETVMLVMLICI